MRRSIKRPLKKLLSVLTPAYASLLVVIVGLVAGGHAAFAQTLPPGYFYCNGVVVPGSQGFCTSATSPAPVYCNGYQTSPWQSCSPAPSPVAPQAIPAWRFYGNASVNGQPAPAGATVAAWSLTNPNSLCGTGAVNGSGGYYVDIQGSSTCVGGTTFTINGQAAAQTGWPPTDAAGAVRLDLTVGTATLLPLTPFVQPPSPPVLPPSFAPPAPQQGLSVGYASGWNLIGGPTGTSPSGLAQSLFTFQASDVNYEVLPPGASLQGGQGYWALFSGPDSATLPPVAPQTTTVSLPAGHWIMVGNPSDGRVNVSGADIVDAYDAIQGQYYQTTILGAGQGAWVFSTYGGTLTMTPSY